jgi:Ca2+-transporting ATPase
VLTGEAMDVSKYTEALPESDKNCVLQAKNNILFSSTTVSNGQALAVVVETGM